MAVTEKDPAGGSSLKLRHKKLDKKLWSPDPFHNTMCSGRLAKHVQDALQLDQNRIIES